MNPHAHFRSRSAGFAQLARCAGAERCSAKPLLHPPKGVHAASGAPREYFFRTASPVLQGAALQEA